MRRKIHYGPGEWVCGGMISRSICLPLLNGRSICPGVIVVARRDWSGRVGELRSTLKLHWCFWNANLFLKTTADLKTRFFEIRKIIIIIESG
jgi:hypothetical protein